MNVPFEGKSCLHPLFERGHKEGGEAFARLVEMSKRGYFSQERIDSISKGNEGITRQELQNVLFDCLRFGQKKCDENKDYNLLNTIANPVELKPVPKPSSLGTQGPSSKREDTYREHPDFIPARSVRTFAPEKRKGTPAVSKDGATKIVSSKEKLPVAVMPASKPLSKIATATSTSQKRLTATPPKVRVKEVVIAKGRTPLHVSKKYAEPSAIFPLVEKVKKAIVNPVSRELVEAKEDYFIINGKGVPFNAEAMRRFWGNLSLLRSEQMCDMDTVLAVIEMPVAFFIKLELGTQMLTPTQVVRFARGLGVTVERLLR